MKKKTLALICSVMMLCSSMNVFAATKDCTVKADASSVHSTYVVALPANVTLSFDELDGLYKGSYQIGAYGIIQSGKKLSVAPPSTVTLRASGQDDVTANITQQIKKFVPSGSPAGEGEMVISTSQEAMAMANGIITAEINNAGNYSGTFSFTVTLE